MDGLRGRGARSRATLLPDRMPLMTCSEEEARLTVGVLGYIALVGLLLWVVN